jgi:hypothetical protein
MPAAVQVFKSPELGQFDFPWVEQDMSLGMVGPRASSAAGTRNPSVNSTKSGSGSGSNSSEEELAYHVSSTSTQMSQLPSAGSGSEQQRPSPRAPSDSQLSRGMFGDHHYYPPQYRCRCSYNLASSLYLASIVLSYLA